MRRVLVIGHRCPEPLRREFLRWIGTYPSRRRAGVLASLGEFERRGGRVAVLRSRGEIDAFVVSAPSA